MATPAPAKAQGLLELLFGRPQVQTPPAEPAQAGSRQTQRSARPKVARKKPVAPLDGAGSSRPSRQGEVAARAVVLNAIEAKSPVAPFLGDPTLTNGDVVVGRDGLYVFRGSGGSRHHAAQFVPLSRAGSGRSAFAQIERANRQVAGVSVPAIAGPRVKLASRPAGDRSQQSPSAPAQKIVAEGDN